MRQLTLDIETYDADKLFVMPPEEFVRLIGFKWGDGPVQLTTHLDVIKHEIGQADRVTGHNIIAFDLQGIYGVGSEEPIRLADQGRLFDTFVHAPLAYPAPEFYTNRQGQRLKADKPEQLMKFYSLDNLCFQLGLKGKVEDLTELALEYGNPALPRKQRILDGFGKIPIWDERFTDYLIGDVDASHELGEALLKQWPLDDYCLREQRIATRAAMIRANGIRIDTHRAQDRVTELAVRRDDILGELEDKYGLPTHGDAPWATDAGKAAILAALADQGITPETKPDWPKTPAWGKRQQKIAESRMKANELELDIEQWRTELDDPDLPDRSKTARLRWIETAREKIIDLRDNPLPPGFGLSFGGKELIELTKGTPAEELGQALAELKGQRSLAQLALDSTYPDGFCHPTITMLQRSGRWSFTKPGLTVWTARGEGAVEKAYYLADNDDHARVEFDYSNADARMVAAYSGDKRFAERFKPGVPCQRRGHKGTCSTKLCGFVPTPDGHMINAIAGWGKEVVDTDPQGYRQKAKIPGHGWGYGAGPKTLVKQAGMEYDLAKAFCDGMNREFVGVVGWRRECTKAAQRTGFVINDWGRRMPVEPGREYTQAPALKGQSGTREIACDFLLSLSIDQLRTVKAFVHDAFLFSLPKKTVQRSIKAIEKAMTTTFKPKQGGQRIAFPVSHGEPGENWFEASHA